jgi:hypothetical protein
VNKADRKSNVVVELADGRTTVKRLASRENWQYLQRALGVTVGDTLYAANCIVLVPGATEIGAIEKLAERFPACAFPMEGVAMLAKIPGASVGEIARVCSTLGVHLVVRLDRSDSEDREIRTAVARGLLAEAAIVWLGNPDVPCRFETEDTLPLSKLVASVNEIYGSDLEPEAVASRAKVKKVPIARAINDSLSADGKLDPEQGVNAYDKVEAVMRCIDALDETEVPTWFSELAKKVTATL